MGGMTMKVPSPTLEGLASYAAAAGADATFELCEDGAYTFGGEGWPAAASRNEGRTRANCETVGRETACGAERAFMTTGDCDEWGSAWCICKARIVSGRRLPPSIGRTGSPTAFRCHRGRWS